MCKSDVIASVAGNTRENHFIGGGQSHQHCGQMTIPILAVPLSGELRNSDTEKEEMESDSVETKPDKKPEQW